MKKYTSRFLKAIATLYMGFPFTYITFLMALFDVPFKKLGDILFSPFYYFVAIVGVIAGVGLWEARRWAWYVFAFLQFLMIYYSASVVFRLGETHQPVIAYLFLVLSLGFVFVRISNELRVPYLMPKIRWWESGAQYQISVPVTLTREDKTTVEGYILDLSLGGCFVKLRDEIKADERVTARFAVFGQITECRGTIVWKTHSTVTLPRGVGVMFAQMNGQKLRRLRVMHKRLKKIMELCRRPKVAIDSDQFMRNLAKMQESVGQHRK